MDLGDEARKGYVMKLVGNFFINNLSEWIAEGMTLGDKNGIPRETMLQYLNSCFPGPIIPSKALEDLSFQLIIKAQQPTVRFLWVERAHQTRDLMDLSCNCMTLQYRPRVSK